MGAGRGGGGMTSLWVAAIFVPLANKHIFMIFFLQYARNWYVFTPTREPRWPEPIQPASHPHLRSVLLLSCIWTIFTHWILSTSCNNRTGSWKVWDYHGMSHLGKYHSFHAPAVLHNYYYLWLRSGKQEWTVCGPDEHAWCGPDLGKSNFVIREA